MMHKRDTSISNEDGPVSHICINLIANCAVDMVGPSQLIASQQLPVILSQNDFITK